MVRIAIYGKGGIGKSTTSSNISYSLARKGAKVLQIGCDPKHDSTRSLLGGRSCITVLDYIRRTSPKDRSLQAVMETGVEGISCIEAGGPEPGIGCAGRGILTTFDTLRKLGIDSLGHDVTVYDVLGDVVCGGFAVPLRGEYADAVYIVTSGEFMSIYAANNILKGIRNFDHGSPRVAGLILNRRGMDCEERIVSVFSSMVGVPVVADIARSEEYAAAESCARTVAEMFPGSAPAEQYRRLADDILGIGLGNTPLYDPTPLDDEQLNELASGRTPTGRGRYVRDRSCTARGYIGIGSCATRGAVYMAGRVTDMPIVIHGPRCCGYVMSHTQDVHHLEYALSNREFVPRLRNHICCTCMSDTTTIFGGRESLRKTLEGIAASGKGYAVVITTCVSGMIGDDVGGVVAEVERDHPGFCAFVVKADGNLSGDSEVGRLLVLDAYLDLLGTHPADSGEGRICLVDDNFMWFSRGDNEHWTKRLLGMLGAEVSVKLFEECTVDQVRGTGTDVLAVLVDGSDLNVDLGRRMESKGFTVFSLPLPEGYRQTLEWVSEYCRYVGRECDDAVRFIEDEYRECISEVSGDLSGRRVTIIASKTTRIDWALEALQDAGATVTHVLMYRVGPNTDSFHSRFADDVDIRWDVTLDRIDGIVEEDDPDIVIGTPSLIKGLDRRTMPITREFLTHWASIKLLRRIRDMLHLPVESGWRSWGDAL